LCCKSSARSTVSGSADSCSMPGLTSLWAAQWCVPSIKRHGACVLALCRTAAAAAPLMCRLRVRELRHHCQGHTALALSSQDLTL
jgi:hypothetical protein